MPYSRNVNKFPLQKCILTLKWLLKNTKIKLHDEINIGYDVEDDDLPDEIEEDSWIDGLLTSGFHAVNDDELFGEEITGYSLY